MVEDSEPISPHPLLWLMFWVLLFTLGLWSRNSGFVVFIEGLKMMHRRLQEGLLRVHGYIEDSYKTKATLIPVTVSTFEAR